MVNDSIMSKIKALLAMAEHPNSNENEAAIALERAQALLFEHNLSRADIQSDGTTPTPAGIGQIDGIETAGYSWKATLLNVIAKSTLCHVVGSPSSKTWHLFGTFENVSTTLEMYHWVIPQLETMALNGYKEYKNHCGDDTARTWKAGFFFGATMTIRDRLAKPYETFKYSTGTAIVAYNDKAVSTAVHKVYPHLSHRSSSARISDGTLAGKQAGNNVTLTPTRRLSGTLALGRG